ncbi:MAG: hypothetical protein ACFCUN_14200 [Hyphomicrobiaceae bacterium]
MLADVANDEKISQVREILFGDVQRENRDRILQLEARLQEFAVSVQHRIDALEARLDALAGETEHNRRADLEDIAKGLINFGETVRRLSRP